MTVIVNNEIHNLDEAGYIKNPHQRLSTFLPESWYVPHHWVHHNGKVWLVFNCSFKNSSISLNELSLSLIWVHPWSCSHYVSVNTQEQSVMTKGECCTRFDCYRRTHLKSGSFSKTWTEISLQMCMNGRCYSLVWITAPAVPYFYISVLMVRMGSGL